MFCAMHGQNKLLKFKVTDFYKKTFKGLYNMRLKKDQIPR